MELAESVFKDVFRKNLQFFRKSEDFTQNELSLRCDFSKSYVGKIERGDVDPSLESIQRLSDVLDVNPVLFFLPLSGPTMKIEPGDEPLDTEEPNGPRNTELRSPEHSLEFLADQMVDYYQHFEQFYEGSPFGDLLVNSDGAILHANRTFQDMIGIELPSHSLNNLRTYVHPSDRSFLKEFLDQAFSEKTCDNMILRFGRDKGDSFTGYVKVQRVESPDTGLLPDCEESSAQYSCSNQTCVRLLVLDVSELPTRPDVNINSLN